MGISHHGLVRRLWAPRHARQPPLVPGFGLQSLSVARGGSAAAVEARERPPPPPPWATPVPAPRAPGPPSARDMLAAALGGGAAAARKAGRRPPRRVTSEAYPESEFAAAAGGAGAGAELRLADLMAGLGEEKGRLGANRRLLQRLERRGAPVEAPLPRAVRERQERRAGYEETSKDVTKWQPIVKVGGRGGGVGSGAWQARLGRPARSRCCQPARCAAPAGARGDALGARGGLHRGRGARLPPVLSGTTCTMAMALQCRAVEGYVPDHLGPI
jgi:hypothetical protein